MRQNLWSLNESMLLAFFGAAGMSDPPAIMEVQAQRAKEAVGMEKTQNGRYVAGDRIAFEGVVERITANGTGIQVAIPIDGHGKQSLVGLHQRTQATVTQRVHKTAGQLLWEAIGDEAISRMDGSAHPTQPWGNLLPETQARYERRAAEFEAARAAQQ